MTNITLPSKPQIQDEDGFKASFVIENLYPGYGHTFGNALRRIILSSIPGVAVTTVKIDGVDHEFSTIEGVREDVVTMLMNLKRVVFRLEGDEEIECSLVVKGEKTYLAQDIDAPSEVEIINPEAPLLTVNDKKASFTMTFKVKGGIGYVAKEDLYEGKLPVGLLVMDTSFTPIRRVTYEVENMRVGNRTDFNRIKIYLETDGTLTPQEVMDQALEIMRQQITAMAGA